MGRRGHRHLFEGGGISRPVAQGSGGGLVTCQLAQRTQTPVQPVRQGVKPEYGTVQRSQPQTVTIATADVRLLMREDGLESRLVSGLIDSGKENRGCKGGRAKDRSTDAHVNRSRL